VCTLRVRGLRDLPVRLLATRMPSPSQRPAIPRWLAPMTAGRRPARRAAIFLGSASRALSVFLSVAPPAAPLRMRAAVVAAAVALAITRLVRTTELIRRGSSSAGLGGSGGPGQRHRGRAYKSKSRSRPHEHRSVSTL
jgi:hypothetical protein